MRLKCACLFTFQKHPDTTFNTSGHPYTQTPGHLDITCTRREGKARQKSHTERFYVRKLFHFWFGVKGCFVLISESTLFCSIQALHFKLPLAFSHVVGNDSVLKANTNQKETTKET